MEQASTDNSSPTLPILPFSQRFSVSNFALRALPAARRRASPAFQAQTPPASAGRGPKVLPDRGFIGTLLAGEIAGVPRALLVDAVRHLGSGSDPPEVWPLSCSHPLDFAVAWEGSNVEAGIAISQIPPPSSLLYVQYSTILHGAGWR